MIGLAVDAHPVITTATDVNGLPAPDVLARQCQFQVDDFKALINVNAAIVKQAKPCHTILIVPSFV